VKHGGTFESLTAERKAEYYQNKTAYHTRRSGANPSVGSALNYCKEAGLMVTGYNEKNMLILCIDGLNIAGNHLMPVTQSGNTIPADVTPSTKAVTP
jgi:hypothetical protein